MQSSLLRFIAASAFVALVAAQCRDADPKCATYQASGFCQNRFYSPVQKATFCARTCNLCNVVVPATTTTKKPTTTTKAPVASPDPCAVTLDDTPATSVNVTRGTTFATIALNNKKAKSVKVPEKCSIALAKVQTPTPTDIFEVIGAAGDVTAATTGAATALFGRCACDKDRKCAVTIDVAGTPRVVELARVADATTFTDLVLAGKTVNRAYVPDGCTLRLGEAAGANPVTQTTGAVTAPNNAKGFANCNCS